MKRNRKAPKNGVELMAQIFEAVCETAPKRTIMDAEQGQGMAVKLESGPNEGQAALFYRDRSLIKIEFHYGINSVLYPDHIARKWLQLSHQLHETQITDPLFGKMYEESFFMNDPDFGMLIPARWNLMPFAIKFLELIPKLDRFHIWNNEYEAAWEKVMETDFSRKTSAVTVA